VFAAALAITASREVNCILHKYARGTCWASP
jgi:hypothetical protein